MLSLHHNDFSSSSPSFLFLLADDIGWGDVGYNNGTAFTPNLDAWASRGGSLKIQDMHTGGTVCSPTRATVLTGRSHQRDCVNYVYDCSDPSEYVAGKCSQLDQFRFAPQRTFTVADAASAAGYESYFAGKWHLGSFFNDTEDIEGLKGVTSSPQTHGFTHFNATMEVAPTATTNSQCRQEWNDTVNYGHYGKPNHCAGGPNPGGGDLQDGCCFNFWWDNDTAANGHGVTALETNLATVFDGDDSRYVADAFRGFLDTRNDGQPFVAQISFHNCHIPFIGSDASRAACVAGETCRLPELGAAPYTDAELDYYSCLTELDGAIGEVLQALQDQAFYDNTMVMFATDNGPEVNCKPEGRCGGTQERPAEAPGSSGPFRGRKRDIWEGGHRVPGIVSWPLVVGNSSHDIWHTPVVTMDFLPTILEALNVERPQAQQEWALDGLSLLPLLQAPATPMAPERSIGWWYYGATPTVSKGYGFRQGNWKLVVGSASCTLEKCQVPQLYDLSVDLGERNDLSLDYPDVLSGLLANFSVWNASVAESRRTESKCDEEFEQPEVWW
jgi:arylsulfatase A-like enzyme